MTITQNNTVVIPAKAGIQSTVFHGLFASLTPRADFQSFNALLSGACAGMMNKGIR